MQLVINPKVAYNFFFILINFKMTKSQNHMEAKHDIQPQECHSATLKTKKKYIYLASSTLIS